MTTHERVQAWPEVFGDLEACERDLYRIECEARYRADAWTWIKECVTTVDELIR